MSSNVLIEINGKSLDVASGSTIIEAADQAGVYIPRFCYHKKLTVAANCRMCLVEVEKSGKPLPACATPVSPGMKVFTRSEKTKAAQKAVMEFLLINHPLDCPICDQGGQCELQDLAMTYGRDRSEFEESKRAVKDDDLGSLIATEMTRCIHCTRCVRFGSEIAGIKELGATGRGAELQITTYIKQSLRSELSGNMIDVCPVGALTSKPFRFKARAWELSQSASITPHDCIGSHAYLQSYQQRVVRVVPKENEAINETWLSDRDRYSYLGLDSPDRLRKPMLKSNGQWQETDWETALDYAVTRLKRVISSEASCQLGGLISASATLEEMYLLQKLCRHLGSNHIDHRLRELDTRDQAYSPFMPKAEKKIQELAKCDMILLVGSHIQREQPVLTARLRKASLNGTYIAAINGIDYESSFKLDAKCIVSPTQLPLYLKALTQGYLHQEDKVSGLNSQALNHIIERLRTSKHIAILVGAFVYHHPQAAALRAQIAQLAQHTQAAELHLTEGANSAGAWIAGAVPHRTVGGVPVLQPGRTACEMLTRLPLKAYLLVNLEVELDSAWPQQAHATLQATECVVAISSFKSKALLETADIILPLALFAETSGTLVNVEGRWQSFQAAIPPLGEAKPGWQILQHLCQRFKVSSSDYSNADAIKEAIQVELTAAGEMQNPRQDQAKGLLTSVPLAPEKEGLVEQITEWPLYSSDPLVRRAKALQESGSCDPICIYVNPQVATQLQLSNHQSVKVKQAQGDATLTVQIDPKVPAGCVRIPFGNDETASMGSAFESVQILPLSSGQ